MVYTSEEEDSQSGVETSGWGLRAQLFDLHGERDEVLETEKAYGPVQERSRESTLTAPHRDRIDDPSHVP
jgi:hypothetical protein